MTRSVEATASVHAHSWNGDGRTLCGVACEGSPTDGEPAPVFARIGDEVTCSDCRNAIRYCRNNFRNFRVVHE